MKGSRLSSFLFAVVVLLLLGGLAAPRATAQARHALGEQRLLILTVSFPDVPNPPPLRERLRDGIAEYYAVQSWGKLQIRTAVKGWYPLPASLADYKISPFNANVDHERVRRLVEDAFTAAEHEVAFDHYDVVLIVVGVETTPGTGYGMIALSANPGLMNKRGMRHGNATVETVSTPGGQRFTGGIAIVAMNAHVGHAVHDLTHGLGGVENGKRVIPDLYDVMLQGRVGPLDHESFPKFTVFMGPWDVMSRHFARRQSPPLGMSSFTRLRLGWIGDDQIADISPGTSQAVTLSALTTGKGTLVARIPDGWGRYYLLENRQTGPGDQTLPASGLLILRVDESREDGDGIVRVVDANPEASDFTAAVFGVAAGQTPSARLSEDVALEVLWQRGTDLTVMITTESLAPDVRATATRIREMEQRLRDSSGSPARAQVTEGLTTARTLLAQMKIPEAGAVLDSLQSP